MESEIKPFFEIKDGADFIRIDISGNSYPEADDEWDRKWLNGIVSLKAGAFQGKYSAQFMISDFESFKGQLESAYINLNGNLLFTCLEDYLEMRIQGDGIGHFNADCIAIDNASFRTKLEFELSFDQTQIPELLRQLKTIISEFTVLDINNN